MKFTYVSLAIFTDVTLHSLIVRLFFFSISDPTVAIVITAKKIINSEVLTTCLMQRGPI